MIKNSEGKIWHFRKGLIDFSGNVIKSVFGIILLVLSVSSVIYTCELKNTETALEVTFYNRDNILKYIILCIIFLSVLLIKKRKKKNIEKKKISFNEDKINQCLIGVHAIIGLIWVVGIQLKPRADQWFCSTIGGNLLTSNYDKIDFSKGGYLDQYPFQSGLVLIFKMVYKFFGINNYMAFQMLNIIALIIMDIFLIKILKKFISVRVEKITLFFLILFFPIVFYTTFLYGNLIGCALSIVAIFYELSFFEKHKILDMIFSAMFISLAILFKSNYLIILLAMIIFTILDWIIHLQKRNIIFVIVIIIGYMIATSGPIALLNSQENVNLGTGIPKVAWIAMGMQESDMAPGWYNEYNANTYLNNNCDSELTSKEALNYINDRVKYFEKNPKYTLKFYAKKMVSQWCEPTFGGIWINQFDKNIVVSSYMDSILNGHKLGKILVWILDIVQSIINNLAMIYLFINRKNRNIYVWLPATAFIGGFLFHMLWEAKGQYTFTYFILLIPYAAIALKNIVKKIEDTEN